MSEEYAIIMFPKFEDLLKESEQLRTEFSMLLLERDNLQYIECKNIETAYLLTFGSLEYKSYELECEMRRLHRKIELIQTKINRQEKISLSSIEELLDEEFAIYRQRLEEQIAKMNEAIEYNNQDRMTEQESKEFKKLYRKIVKALHPDLNPKATSEQIRLLENAVQAYKNGDMISLQLISEMVSEPKLPDKNADGVSELVKDIERLEKNIDLIKEQIQNIKSEYPYTLKAFMDSLENIAEKKSELNKRIEEITEVIEYYKDKIERMLSKQ